MINITENEISVRKILFQSTQKNKFQQFYSKN